LARQSRSSARRGGNPALRLAAVRQFHGYFGVFIAPSILFFALTGSLQLFGLHESHGAYRPPAIIEKLGMLHKDQVFAAKPRRPAPVKAVAPRPTPRPVDGRDEGPSSATLALKWFFLFVAMSLLVSTTLGLWMALAYSAQKGRLWLLFLAGAAVPLAILLV
jgi:hypothetical protein